MWEIVLKGKPGQISREEARSWIWASLSVLCYHNLHPVVPLLTYQFLRRMPKGQENCVGLAWHDFGKVALLANRDAQGTFTTILHETVHLCVEFPDGSVEACTTRLCSRIKQDVSQLAHILLEGTYKRAAAIAHTKIAYPPKNGQDDFYDPAQHTPVNWQGRYRGRTRKNR